MQIRLTKTADWIKATVVSSIIKGIKIRVETPCTKYESPEQFIKLQAQPTTILTSVCPPIEFANNLVAKLNGLQKKESASTGTSIKATPIEVFGGRSKVKKRIPYRLIQM